MEHVKTKIHDSEIYGKIETEIVILDSEYYERYYKDETQMGMYGVMLRRC